MKKLADDRRDAASVEVASLGAPLAARPRALSVAGIAIGVLLVSVVVPQLLSAYWLDVANQAAIACLGAIALNMLVGVAGQVSLGSAAFMGIGAFTAVALGVQNVQLPFLVVLPIAAIAGGVGALIVGTIALRVQGLYLVLATLALHYIVLFAMKQYQVSTAGPGGFVFETPSIVSWPLDDERQWYPVLLLAILLTALICRNIQRGRSGRAWTAVRDKDIAAAILGINVARAKIQAFVITSMIIALQGALQAYYVGVATYETYTLDLTVQYFAMIVIGGLGSLTGSVVGAVLVTILRPLVNVAMPHLPAWFPLHDQIIAHIFAAQSILFGVFVIAFMRYGPRGIVFTFARHVRGARARQAP